MKDLKANATEQYQPNDLIALEMGRIAAQRLTPARLEQFRTDLDRLRSHSRDSAYFRAWDKIIESGPAAVRRALIEPSERGQVLRSVISFRAFVSKNERDEIFLRFTRSNIAGKVR